MFAIRARNGFGSAEEAREGGVHAFVIFENVPPDGRTDQPYAA